MFTATALSLACAQVAAQDKPANPLVPSLETVVVVSSRQETPLREVATSVAVLEEAQIEKLGYTALVDALRTLPSVSVSNSGGMGKTTTLRVRGEAGYRTLVQIDGVDVSDPTGTQSGAQIQHILSSDVGRVELLRGPQGLMYGADAGGVLNISTRQAEQGNKTVLSGEAGRYNSQRGSLNTSGASDKLDYFVSVARAETEGFNTSKQDTLLKDNDGYDNTTLHARLGANLTENLRVEAVARNTDASAQYDRCGWPAIDDCTSTFEQDAGRLSLSHRLGRLDNSLAYSKSDISRQSFAAGVNDYDTEGSIEKLEWLGRAYLSEAHTLAYGLERRSDSVREMERDQDAVYLEYQGRYADRVFFTAGGRSDDNDDFGRYDTYRTSAAYVQALDAGELKFKATYGTGFRAPSLFEIDYNQQQTASYGYVLAPLTPEESEGVDVGVEYFGSNGLHLEAVLFKQTIEREIAYDSVGWTGYIQGDGENRSEGIELIANMPLADQWIINLNYTYTDTKTATGSARPRVPRQLANLGFTYAASDALQLAVNLRHSADAKETTGADLDNYQVLDASVNYQVTPMLAFYLRGENLTDKDYVEIVNYNTAGAAAYAGVKITF
ncbi:TonB-dependent receptor [Cellvibrio japonicus]|nr:TonB-dependent receptor [Cellvibrio japonicus]QEI17917.1 TonB-dependent receptor [Cellvibrio japonicus]QEI21494.1 TonB-dependent receptor [Cellvibrio japonicus]